MPISTIITEIFCVTNVFSKKYDEEILEYGAFTCIIYSPYYNESQLTEFL